MKMQPATQPRGELQVEAGPGADNDKRAPPFSGKQCQGGQGVAALIIAGSNANRLTAAFTDLGKKVETISGVGWKITPDSVDTLLPILKAKLDLLDPAAPVILWCMNFQAAYSNWRPRRYHRE